MLFNIFLIVFLMAIVNVSFFTTLNNLRVYVNSQFQSLILVQFM